MLMYSVSFLVYFMLLGRFSSTKKPCSKKNLG